MNVAKQLVCVEPADPVRLEIQSAVMRRPGKGEVLVEVDATTVNPIDVKRANGYGRLLLSLKGAGKFPLVLGNDFVGTIIAVGKSSSWQEGDRVIGLLPTGKAGGAHATHLIAPQDLIRSAIANLSPEVQAVFPYSFTTAWLALGGAGITENNAKGLKVLVHGASGGLGQLALQLLTRWGASVTAICSTQHLALCESLGAARVWDRIRHRLDELPDHFDASLNFGAWEDDAALVGRLRRGALGHATTVHPLLANFDRHGFLRGAWRSRQDLRRMQSIAAAKGARYRWTIFRPDTGALDALHHLLTQNPLILPLSLSVPFSDADLAFDHVTRQKSGRAVLLPHR